MFILILEWLSILFFFGAQRAAVISGGALEASAFPKAAEMAAALPSSFILCIFFKKHSLFAACSAEDAAKPMEKFWLRAMQNCRVIAEQVTGSLLEVVCCANHSSIQRTTRKFWSI